MSKAKVDRKLLRKKKGPGRGRGCPLPLPLIRTCPVKASGSSHHGLACAVLPISVTWTAPGVQSPRPVSHRSVRDEAPPSLHRVPAHGFPAFDGTMRRSDSLTPSPHASFRFAWRYRSRRRYFAPTDPARVIGRPGLGDPGPGREYAVEGAGRPTFLGNPDGPMPCSPTPARPTPPGHGGDAARPPHTSKARALAGNALGAQSHDLSPGCLRFAVALRRPAAATVPKIASLPLSAAP